MIVIDGLTQEECLHLGECVEDAYMTALENAEDLGVSVERHVLHLAPDWLAINDPAACLRGFEEVRAMSLDSYSHKPTPLHCYLMMAILDPWFGRVRQGSAAALSAQAAYKAMNVFRDADFNSLYTEVTALLEQKRYPVFDLVPYLAWLPPTVARDVEAALARVQVR